MRIMLGLVLLGLLIVTGCGNSGPAASTATMDSTTASAYSELGVEMTQAIANSMGGWASQGSVSGLTAASITGPDSNGYFHLIDGSSTLLGTYETDFYVKIITNESDVVTDIYTYGTYSYSYSYLGTTVTYLQTYGTSANPFHGTVAVSGSDYTLSLSGALQLDISSVSLTTGNHTAAMTFTFTGYSLPYTTGDDYPTGTVAIASTYDGVAQPDITITFNGTSTATFSYGTYSSTLTLPAS